MNNFTFGMSKLRITQNYHQTVSHKYHWYNSKNYADYPIDIAGIDNNKEIYYAPVDMKVVAIKGIGNSMTNTILVVATEKCNTPSGIFTPFIALTHWNDEVTFIDNKFTKVINNGSLRFYSASENNSFLHLVLNYQANT